MYRKASESLVSFLDNYDAERALTKESLRQYAYAVKSIESWSGRGMQTSDLKPEVFNNWLRDLSEKDLSPSTVACRRRHLLALWRAAAESGKAEEPPRRLRKAKVPWIAPRAWTVDEVRAILATCSTLKRNRPGQMPRGEWWSLAVRIAWETALRSGDLMRLRADAFDRTGLGVVTQSKTSRPVVVRLSESTLGLLQKSLQNHPRKLALPWGASKESFRRQFQLIVKNAGVRPGTWKWLRRSSATDVEKACPGAGAAHLGHAHGSTIAARHYLDPYIIGSPHVMPTMLDN